ncbi:MAG: AAA family ATPase [Gammaproteobacteria bacterium]
MDNVIRIDAIELENFRGQTGRYETAGNQIHFFTGWNGAGKSSILDAVRLAMLGRCRGTTASGGGFKQLIGEGRDFASVKLYGSLVDGDAFILTVSIGSALKGMMEWSLDVETMPPEVSNCPITLSDMVDVFWRRVGARHAECALWPELFLDSKALGGALSDRFSGEIDTGAALATDDLEIADDVGKLIKEAKVDPTAIAGLIGLGEFAYDKRRDVNRGIKRLEMLVIEALPVAPDGFVPGSTQVSNASEVLESAKGLMVQLQSERESAIALAGAILNPPRQVTKQDLDQAEREVTRLVAELSQKQGLQIEAVVQVEEEEGGLESRREEVKKDQDRIEEIDARLAEMNSPPLEVCSVCKRKFTKAQLASQAKAEVHERETLETERPTCVAGVKGGDISIPIGKEELEAARNALSSAVQQVADARTLWHKAEAHLGQLRESAGNQGKAIDTEGARRKVEALAVRISRGQAVVLYLEATSKRQAQRTELKDLQRQVMALTWAIDRFHKGAWLKREMLKHAAEWIHNVNCVLDPFGYCLTLDMDKKEIALRFRSKPDGGFYDIELASKGERAILAAGIALAFADGGVVLLDDLDGLDGVNKRRFFSMLQIQAEGVGTVYLAGAWALSAEYNGQALEKATGFGCHWVDRKGA